jgi:hypothetical protein
MANATVDCCHRFEQSIPVLQSTIIDRNAGGLDAVDQPAP